ALARPRQRRLGRRSIGAARRRANAAHTDHRRKAGDVSEETQASIVIAVEIDNPDLADRLASLLDGIEGLRLAAPGEAATVAIVARDRPRAAEPHGFDLTHRDVDVLDLLAGGDSDR